MQMLNKYIIIGITSRAIDNPDKFIINSDENKYVNNPSIIEKTKYITFMTLSLYVVILPFFVTLFG